MGRQPFSSWFHLRFLIKDACCGEKRGAADMVSEQATMRNIDCTEMRERSVLICRPPCSSPGNLCGCCTKAHAKHRLYRDEGEEICADLSPALRYPWKSLWLLHQGTSGT